MDIAVKQEPAQAAHVSEPFRRPLIILTATWSALLPLTNLRLADSITPADLLLAITALFWLIATALIELSIFARMTTFLFFLGLTFTLTALGSGLYARDVWCAVS